MTFFWIVVFLLLSVSLLMSLLIIAGLMLGKGEPLPPPPPREQAAQESPIGSGAPTELPKNAPRRTGVG